MVLVYRGRRRLCIVYRTTLQQSSRLKMKALTTCFMLSISPYQHDVWVAVAVVDDINKHWPSCWHGASYSAHCSRAGNGSMGHGSLGVDPWPISFLTLCLGLYIVAMIIYQNSINLQVPVCAVCLHVQLCSNLKVCVHIQCPNYSAG